MEPTVLHFLCKPLCSTKMQLSIRSPSTHKRHVCNAYMNLQRKLTIGSLSCLWNCTSRTRVSFSGRSPTDSSIILLLYPGLPSAWYGFTSSPADVFFNTSSCACNNAWWQNVYTRLQSTYCFTTPNVITCSLPNMFYFMYALIIHNIHPPLVQRLQLVR